MDPALRALLAASAAALLLAACVRREPATSPAAGYASLPDTLVCVVDRTTDRGLRELPAKRTPEGTALLLVDGRTQPLESVHPVSLIAGYGGREGWYSAGEPVELRGQRFVRVESERSIPPDLLRRTGEYRGIPLFADPGDEPPPEAVYLPVRPGCIFQAYVREDLVG